MDGQSGYRRCHRRRRHRCHRFCCPAAGEVGREIDLSHLDDLLTSDISNRSIYFANIFRLLVAAVVPFSSLIRGLSLLVEMSVFIHV